MSNTPKVSERKIRPPPDFNGNREEADNFLNSCRVYLRLNAQSYSTDEEKIIFTINEERIIVFYGRAICAIRDTLSVTRFRLSQNSERRW